MRFIYLLVFFFVTITIAHAQLKAVHKKGSYSYWVNTPAQSDLKADKWPILVFLHGRSLSGSDINRVKRYGVLRAMEKGRSIDAIVVAPQTSNGWDADKVMNIVDEVLESHGGDPNRIYVCGMSMGAYGTMDVAGKYPDRIAAAVAICGGGTLSLACGLTQVPLWIQHGNSDRVVPLSESQKIYKAIKKCNPEADATLTVVPGGTHGSVESLFHQDAIYDWMFGYAL
ncbi:carboxylesterase family protein [Sphingobacterium corticibacter]|uniref:Phospholipase n=1 Tax=Sphingobacterium corticibacter TaxID=2171749 RepID=A0A2T8HIV6_9SPHI|nr:PHB depolymerase family esterase [Sphingobacterium corticibacter]PVH25371.1 phospholipase [Sphingobacterium corticibacter]